MAKYSIYLCESETCGFVFGDLRKGYDTKIDCPRCGHKSHQSWHTKRQKCSVCGKLHADTIRYYCRECTDAVRTVNEKVFGMLDAFIRREFPDTGSHVEFIDKYDFNSMRDKYGTIYVKDDNKKLEVFFMTRVTAALPKLAQGNNRVEATSFSDTQIFEVKVETTRKDVAALLRIPEEDCYA